MLQPNGDGSIPHALSSVSSVARSLLPTRRRLMLDPCNKLYFPCEPGKQVRSVIRIKNTSKSHVVFKFQTTAPKSCFKASSAVRFKKGGELLLKLDRIPDLYWNLSRRLA